MHCVSAIVKDSNSAQIQVIKIVADLFLTNILMVLRTDPFSSITRSSRWRFSVKKRVLRIFAKFLYAGDSFLIKLQASGLQLYEKRDSGTGVFL